MRLLKHVVSDLGLPTMRLIVENSSRRQVARKQEYDEREADPVPVKPGDLQRVEPEIGGGRFIFEHAELQVLFMTDDVVRLAWSPGNPPIPYAITGVGKWVSATPHGGSSERTTPEGPASDTSDTSDPSDTSHTSDISGTSDPATSLAFTSDTDTSVVNASEAWPAEARKSETGTSGHAAWAVPQIAVIDRRSSGWEVISDSMRIRVERDGALTIARRGIATHDDPGRQETVLRRLAPPVRYGSSWEERFKMRSGERLGGLGEQAGGVDLRDGRYVVWNRDAGGAWGPGSGPLYMGIPVVLSAHPEGSLLTFYENPTRGVFGFGSEDASVRFFAGQLRSYVITGSLPHLLERLGQLTGRPALPARWSLGYHQSRWGYKTEKDVRRVLHGYERESLPLSALHLDIDYMDGYRVFTVDERRFPDLAGLTSEMAGRGTRLVTIIDPGVKVDAGYQLYEEGRSDGFFCFDRYGDVQQGVAWPGRVAFPDFTNPRTREWWAKQYRTLTDLGVGGVWHDMNEPASIALRGDPTLPLSTRHDMEGRGGDHSEGHNLYGLLMNRAGYEGLESARPKSRPFIVSRSGWASNQRWAWNWTGDVNSTWLAMRQQVATLIGLGLSGVPFSGSDIGGFTGVPDDELYLRWLQMSAFMGFCRTHSVVGVPAREPWCFDEPTRSRIGGWIRFRYRLLPYLYTLAHRAAATGAPLVRPLWWPQAVPGGGAYSPSSAEHGQLLADAQVLDETEVLRAIETLGDVDDEFLLGDCLLIAPVCEPGAVSRSVSLPSGRWRSIWQGSLDRPGRERPSEALEGDPSKPVVLPGPLEHPPVVVREGSVVPLDDGFADVRGPCALEGDSGISLSSGVPGDYPARSLSTSGALDVGHAPRLLSFHAWPAQGGEARGECVDDEGDGYGPTRHDQLQLDGAVEGANAVLHWRTRGEFPAPSRVRFVLHGFDSRCVIKDGEDIGPTSHGAIECSPFERLELTNLEASRRT
jgi:alpha-glucosidase